MKKAILIIVLVFIFACADLSSAPASNTGFVTRQGNQLILNTNNFYFSSANNYSLFYQSTAVIDEFFQNAASLGLNLIRTWGFCEGTGYAYSFQPTAYNYNEATFAKMDYIIYKANQNNIRLIITLVNNWDDFGGMNKYVEWSPTANSHDDFYTDQWCRDCYKAYVNYFLNRINTYTGVAYKDDPTIMIWELTNEARCGSDPSGDKLQQWIEEMSAYLKSIHNHQMVSTGTEGWYADDPNKDPVTWTGVDFIRNNQAADIDICSYHLFADQYGFTDEQTANFIQSHIYDARNSLNKPVYLGEFGKKANRQAVPFQGAQTLHDFSVDTEGWFSPRDGFIAPLRVSSPSYNGNGALDFLTNGTIGPGNPESWGEGQKQYAAPYADYSGYGDISCWVYLPGGASDDLRSDVYLYTGNSWQWLDGLDVALIPGQWNQVSLGTKNVSNLNSVRAMGIRTMSFNSVYNGHVYYDLVEGVIGNLLDYPAQLAARGSYYSDVYNLSYDSNISGAGFWMLLPDGYIDGDDYGIYPSDTTVSIIQNFSERLKTKSGPAALWDDCETTGNWYVDSRYSDAAAVSLNSEFVKQGSRSLKLDYQVPSYHKAFFENSGANQAGLSEDWSNRKNLIFDLYNPGGPATADVAVSTGSGWIWYESLPKNLTVGWNKITIDLTANNWKSQATNWQYTGRIVNLNQVKRLSVGIFGYNNPGSVYLDNVMLTTAKNKPPKNIDQK